MSVRVLTEVFQSSRSELGSRLVLIALADSAHDDGVTWLHLETLARKTLLVDSTVRAAIKKLGDRGELEVRKAQRGRTRVNVYRIVVGSIAAREVDYTRLPFEVDEPFSQPPNIGGRHEGHDRRESAVETPVDRRSSADVTVSSSFEPSVGPVNEGVAHPANRPGTVARKAVTDAEYDLAAGALEAFNETAHSSYRGPEWIGKIIMRIREHPHLNLEDHRALIASAFRKPWWNGVASPSVVYGNGALFERQIHAASQAAAGDENLSMEEIAARYG